MSAAIKAEEDRMIALYSKITGTSVKGIELLMKEDKPMDLQKAKDLGFVTEIVDGIPKFSTTKAVAVLKSKTQNMNHKNLIDGQTSILGKIEAIWNKISGKSIALDLTLADGKKLHIETEAAAPAKGDIVTVDGKPTPDQSYTLADGTVIKTDADSKISEVNIPQGYKVGDVVEKMPDTELKLANGDIVKTDKDCKIISITKGTPVKTIAELEKENAELKATIATLSDGQKKIEEKLGLISSDWTPEQKQRIFGDKGNEPTNKVTAAADRRK